MTYDGRLALVYGLYTHTFETKSIGLFFPRGHLRQLLHSLFEDYELRDLILDESGDVRPYSRVAINGRFSYLVGYLEARVEQGDIITLIRPYMDAI